MSGLPRLKTGPTFAVKPGQSAGRKSKHAGKSSAAATPRQTPSNDETLAREAEITTLLKELSRSCINANLAPILQEIKAALFERNYPIAFSKPKYLLAYCARWVPGRALAYRDLLSTTDAIVELCERRCLDGLDTSVVCIGGGAGSELIALASLAKHFPSVRGLYPRMSVTAIDSAAWTPTVDGIRDLVQTSWQLSTDRFALSFSQLDILDSFTTIDFASTNIITLLFTTNELFAASKTKSLALMNHLSAVCLEGTLLVVAESAGTYSEMDVAGKTYPLHLVLDQTLTARTGAWRIVEHDAGRWYRVPEPTKKLYPLPIENTHMLFRVYERA